MKRQGRDYIPEGLYKKILAVMPIPCVDIVLVSGRRFLLGKRKNKPAQGQWWMVGGRVRKGERLKQAARRHIKTEIGFSRPVIKKILGTQETIFKNSAQGPASHTINTVFLAEIPYKKYSPADGENTELKWFSKIDAKWPAAVKEALRIAGFK